MFDWLLSPRGAIALSFLTLVSHLWRGFLDAMFVFPVDFSSETAMHAAALVYALLYGGWIFALAAAQRGSHRGFIAGFVINALVLVLIPISWLLFYCPASCRAQAGFLFNLANMLNLILGLLTAVALAHQLWWKPGKAAHSERGSS